MRKLCLWVCVAAVFGQASVSLGAEKVLVGDFEEPAVSGRYDKWFAEDAVTLVSVTAPGVTRGNRALKLTASTGGWGPGMQLPLGTEGVWPEAIEAITAPNAVLVVDVTAFAADFPDGWGELGFSRNTAAASGGWDKSQWQPIEMDGLPHRMMFTITEETKQKVLEGIGGWGSNIGLCLNVGAGQATIYFDNIWLLPSPPEDDLLPHDGLVDQVEDGTDVHATFYWKAGKDPNTLTELPVHPDIVDQYLFLDDGEGGALLYRGNTGDPGQEPDSEFGPVTIDFNRSYRWAVVNVLDGFEQALTPDASTFDQVDPNNLIGPIWQFYSISTIPSITTQPVHARAALGATNVAVFSIQVNSLTPPSFQWFSSVDSVAWTEINSASLPSAATDTLVIPSIAVGYQRYYRCRVSNPSTISGGGTEPDVFSNTVTLVVERKVGEYLFEGNFNDTSGNNNHGTGFNGAVMAAGDSVQGTSALLLDGVNQYIDLGAGAFPKAMLLEAGGVGGGMDAGSILFWVKPSQPGAILSNADPNGFLLVQIENDGDASITVRGDNAATVGYAAAAATPYYNMINDGDWHFVAATWNHRGQMRVYVDTNRAEVNANPAVFRGWQNNVLIGAARPESGDFTVPGNFFGGLIDNLRIYNYVVSPEAIAQEYYDQTGVSSCISLDFAGSVLNVDNTGASYCRVDLADFAIFAEYWLSSGFYPIP